MGIAQGPFRSLAGATSVRRRSGPTTDEEVVPCWWQNRGEGVDSTSVVANVAAGSTEK
jgi:hypothetical protein